MGLMAGNLISRGFNTENRRPTGKTTPPRSDPGLNDNRSTTIVREHSAVFQKTPDRAEHPPGVDISRVDVAAAQFHEFLRRVGGLEQPSTFSDRDHRVFTA